MSGASGGRCGMVSGPGVVGRGANAVGRRTDRVHGAGGKRGNGVSGTSGGRCGMVSDSFHYFLISANRVAG